jgi:putative oxidoreductase
MPSPQHRFDPADPLMPIRVMAGLFYLPHILFKLNGMAGSAAFFGKAGFHPPMLFLVLALVAEVVCAVGLTFGILTKWVGSVSAGVMGFAIYAIFATKGVGWLWNLGGVEYLVFWAVTSLAIAAEAWRREWQAHGRLFLLAPAAA